MMSDDTYSRRGFMASGGIALGGTLIGQHAFARSPAGPGGGKNFTSFSRYTPSFGGPPDSDHYLGKLTPGIRKTGQAPVPFVSPDVEKLPWKMVGGVKEYHIHCTASKREFLPGYAMNVWGYNGSMPGPVIEAFQGDRVRFVVHNELPEATTIHWHGLELPVNMDGVPGMTQKPIPPGKTFVYEYDLHQAGTFFYHSHFAMQESLGMVGFFIIHPRVAFDPPVDRDFGLLYQNFFIRPNADTIDTMMMDWNWHTINGRSGPYTTPLVVKHGERVRLRLLNFSPMQHHPIHLHGHTFWLTGTEAGRIPKTAWVPRNNTLVGVATVQEFEFIAFNPGDWIFHCHMFHHMMNHMVRQVGPRIRPGSNLADYYLSLPDRPDAENVLSLPEFQVPGYPQNMQGMMMSTAMSESTMSQINNRRETMGMLPGWSEPVKGLTTVIRVLPEDLYNRVMNSNEPIKPGEIFNAIVARTKR